MGSKEARRKLLSEIFEICATIREIKIARDVLHTRSLLVAPPNKKEHHLGCEDKLVHYLVDLNHALAIAKNEAIAAGIPEDQVDGIIKFWKLK